jgi:uroporphyrinogen-III decarboxylase
MSHPIRGHGEVVVNRRERLLATLRGEPVDRPAVNFYEIGGLSIDPEDPDPWNVYRDPSWRPLLELAEKETDLIRLRSAVRVHSHEAWDLSGADGKASARGQLRTTETWVADGSRYSRMRLHIGGRELSTVSRRDRDLDTLWTVEPLLKDTSDLLAYLELPDDYFVQQVDVSPLVAEEQRLGDRGIVMVDTEDPLCAAATLFDMQDFTVVAFTEPALFHRLLQKLAEPLYARTEQVAREFPGRLWRIYGPEYATQPYLPPRLFQEYVVGYVQPMAQIIHRHGGLVRLHCHGKIRDNLDQIVALGADAIDPIEPPPRGDVELSYVRQRYGRQLVLFGNLEIADLEQMAPARFDTLVQRTLDEGTEGDGRGFVLMPSSSPCGRTITQRTLRNYCTMVRRVKERAGR